MFKLLARNRRLAGGGRPRTALARGEPGRGYWDHDCRGPEITSAGLLLDIAAWSLATGVLRVAAAIRLRRRISAEWWLAFSGVAAILMAGIMMWNPGAGALGLLWFIASSAIAFGVVLIVLAFKRRRLRGRLQAVGGR